MIAVKKKLDRLLGGFTMYRLVAILLTVLAVEAIVLSLVGQLSSTPLELLASAAVALASTMLSSFICGRLFRVKAHVESAAITGWLLFFILPPSIEPLGLGAIAIAGLVASASKYLLAVRGRHIFNPAAIGALAVTAFGLIISGTWWVSNEYFLPLVAIGAFRILYRSHHLVLGAVFVAAVVVFDVIVSAIDGFTVGEALQYAFTGTATVFLAGFMLSEPLTLPPRRWQQIALAVVVAALFTIPFAIGPLTASPHLALVIGNLLAFFVGQRRGVSLEFTGKEKLSPSTWQFSFAPKRRVAFTPGQYLELSLPHAKTDVRGQRRVFSISSAPTDAGPLTIGVKMSDRSSSFKTALLELEPGTRVNATTVAGDFLLPKDTSVPVLLVAGGIGITPFASQLSSNDAAQRDTVVVYSVSSAEELTYREVLESSGARVIVIAPAAPSTLPEGWEYAGPVRLTAEVLTELVPDVSKRHAFVSGSPALVDDVKRVLKRAKAKRVTTDYFSGY